MAATSTQTGGNIADRDVYSVSRLNRAARALLEQGLARIWLEGELSNVARPASGHLYFTLKDEQAQVRGAMFRNRNQLLRFKPTEGMQVLVRAKVSLYEARGEYQLIAEHMEESGDGALQRAFELLKSKLETQGLFDPGHKQDLPLLPQRIGVITSPSGAAIRDVVSVLQRRFPAIPVLIYPVPVQGKDAGSEIAAMIRTADQRKECDVLVLTRGGGSLEDLWAFNEEVVARAIFDCNTPLVSAVGHEVDFTIADFVADHRAPTPSAAAELVSPDREEWLAQFSALQRLCGQRMQQCLSDREQRLGWLHKRLQLRHPGQYLRQQYQRLDEFEQRIRLAIESNFNKLRSSLHVQHGRLTQATPGHRIARCELQRHALAQRLGAGMRARLQARARRLGNACSTLDAVSPLATLERGYAIVTRPDSPQVIRSTAQVNAGERIEARLGDGRLRCRVEQTLPANKNE